VSLHLAVVPSWRERLVADAARADRYQDAAQRAATAELLRRGAETGIRALALTGSTARGMRTEISDLDYHVVGPKLDLRGLSGELDVVTDSEEGFFDRLARGDDFAQWTLRLGCILLDKDGVMQRGAELIRRDRLWPDPAEAGARRTLGGPCREGHPDRRSGGCAGARPRGAHRPGARHPARLQDISARASRVAPPACVRWRT
jgi:hypothetical protein